MINELISYDYSSNSYILIGDYNILIDPGLPSNEQLKAFFAKNPINIDMIINTHCHYDHVGGNFGDNISIHANDADDLEQAGEKTMFHAFTDKFEGFPVSKRLKDGDIIDNGKHSLEVIHSPGHTSGSICLRDKKTKALFSGDTWFCNGIGRTDLPSGDFQEIMGSFYRLRELQCDHIYPGHGPSFKNNIDDIIKNYFELV